MIQTYQRKAWRLFFMDSSSSRKLSSPDFDFLRTFQAIEAIVLIASSPFAYTDLKNASV
jgi:hypothetical protein